MAAEIQDASDYYIWHPAGKSLAIHLHLDVLDRLAAEVMRGFGAVPKRGAEVGGVLLGTVETANGGPAIVRIEDFEPVECEYKRGPSYLLTDEGRAVFAEAVERWQPDPRRVARAIGFYRSHTREGLTLGAEDIELLDQFFPGTQSIALLVKPYGTKVSEAGFFAREEGQFPAQSPLEFPFRRYELTGEEPPPRRPLMERGRFAEGARDGGGFARRRARAFREREHGADPNEHPDEPPAPAGNEPALPLRGRGSTNAEYPVNLPERSRSSASLWIPLSFVFLLFGVALGFMISFARNPKPVGADAHIFSLGLAVMKSGDNLIVKWDPQAPALRVAQQGMMEIEDGNSHKQVPLAGADLQSGAITYTNSSNAVQFKLTVNPHAQVSVSETAEWRP